MGLSQSNVFKGNFTKMECSSLINWGPKHNISRLRKLAFFFLSSYFTCLVSINIPSVGLANSCGSGKFCVYTSFLVNFSAKFTLWGGL